MKKYFSLLATICAFTLAFAQVPQGVSYQAIAFNAAGSPVANGSVGVRISILDNSATGTAVYTETHTKTTNAQGLFNLNIGQGTPTLGTFSGIAWGTNSKFIKVEIDPAGGSNYTSVGTNQLMSVPYALFANTSNNISNTSSFSANTPKTTSFLFEDYNTDTYYATSGVDNQWAAQRYTSTYGVNSSNGTFYFEDYTADTYYAYSPLTGQWSAQPYTSTYSMAKDTTGALLFEDYAANIYYAYSPITGQWSAQSYSSTYGITVRKNLFIFEDYNADTYFVYSPLTGQWASQPYTSTYGLTISNGSVYFQDYSARIYYMYNSKTGAWHAQPYQSSYNIMRSTRE